MSVLVSRGQMQLKSLCQPDSTALAPLPYQNRQVRYASTAEDQNQL